MTRRERISLRGEMTVFIEHLQFKRKFKVIINKATCTKYCGAQLKMVCNMSLYICVYVYTLCVTLDTRLAL